MIDTSPSVNDNDRRRQRIDRVTRRVVTACGITILFVMLLLFFWLIWVVVPLFSAVELQPSATVVVPQAQPAVALGMDKAQRTGWRIDRSGSGQFLSLDGGAPGKPQTLLPGPVQAVTAADNSTTLLWNGQGETLLVQPDFSAPGAPRWVLPLGDMTRSSSDAPIVQASVARKADDSWIVALADAQQVTLWQRRVNGSAQHTLLPIANARLLLLVPGGERLFVLSGAQLQVWSLAEPAPRLRDAIPLQGAKQLLLLSGGSSLLVAGEQGIAQWFDIASDSGLHLQRIRSIDGARWQPVMAQEAQRRVFATLSPEGDFRLYASKQRGAVFQDQLPANVERMQFSPEGDGLLLERQGRWQHYRLHNPWPDISWRSLWQKVWYENYPQPDYVWQSTSANDSYQGKYSLVPMVAGTLKAAGLAMLFATPLALAAAIYSAWFMSPGLRRIVKPAIEMMGAMPSVVIGLIAGLWLAPRLGSCLLGVLLLPLMLAGVLLLCSRIRQLLPQNRRSRWLADGREVVVLMPILLLTAALSLWLIPIVERVVWPEGLAGYLGADYQQRNLLIAGVAMGFALVPLIFTLAEEAIYSVPVSQGLGSLALGATQWQTLTQVILPGASSGICAALMIGFGRALGETMIVLMATGNTPIVDGGLLQGLRSLAANVAVEMPEAAAGSGHYRILFLSALVLLVFTLVINTLAEMVRQRLRQRYAQQEVQG